jgi:hypothetical protein
MRCLLLVVLLVACTDSPDSGGPSVTSGVVRMQLPMSVNREVDILLVVDNTPAMAAYGDALRANLRGFAEEMRTFDLHLGVITADPADAATLRGTAGLTGNFISDSIGTMPGQRVRNYTGDLADVLERLGDPGTQGAASSPLAAAKRFFEEDVTFQRSNAYTAIFVITANDLPNESTAAYVTAFKSLHADPARVIVGGVTGPGDRLGAFLDQFPNRNARARITDEDWSSVSGLLGTLVKTHLGAACIEGPLLDGDPDAPGVQHVCNAWFDYPGGSELLKSCRTAPDGECWRIVPYAGCPGSDLVDIDHRRIDYPPDTILTLECLTVR